MAEAIARDIFSKNEMDIKVSSRGIYALQGESVSKNAALVMNNMGIDISSHTAKRIAFTDIDEADFIFTMTKSHKEFIETMLSYGVNKAFTIGEYSGHDKDIHDPFGGDINHYTVCAAELKELITFIADRLLKGAEGLN